MSYFISGKLTFIKNQFSVEFNQVRNNLRVRDGIPRPQQVLANCLIAQHFQLFNKEQGLLMFLRSTGHQNNGYLCSKGNWTMCAATKKAVLL
ncbi:unnamed protein product [Macrosiphum euphorbiae]|uniref:Uncharacterized protein n=1 Tax=Macrosiphum euphorbiae TaxID=13131 RepID=A0AAV0Y7L7_9HEMI|nr:unnamed protein product [Macrosiphum euphorbiae]